MPHHEEKKFEVYLKHENCAECLVNIEKKIADYKNATHSEKEDMQSLLRQRVYSIIDFSELPSGSDMVRIQLMRRIKIPPDLAKILRFNSTKAPEDDRKIAYGKMKCTYTRSLMLQSPFGPMWNALYDIESKINKELEKQLKGETAYKTFLCLAQEFSYLVFFSKLLLRDFNPNHDKVIFHLKDAKIPQESIKYFEAQINDHVELIINTYYQKSLTSDMPLKPNKEETDLEQSKMTTVDTRKKSQESVVFFFLNDIIEETNNKVALNSLIKEIKSCHRQEIRLIHFSIIHVFPVIKGPGEESNDQVPVDYYIIKTDKKPAPDTDTHLNPPTKTGGEYTETTEVAHILVGITDALKKNKMTTVDTRKKSRESDHLPKRLFEPPIQPTKRKKRKKHTPPLLQNRQDHPI